MDLNKQWYVPIVCIAAITLLSGCTSESSPSPPVPVPISVVPTPQAPLPTISLPPGTDRLEDMSSYETAPELAASAKFMGLTDVTFPKLSYVELGFIGVAPVETKCIVAFSTKEAVSDGHITAVILSRYDLSLRVVKTNVLLLEVKPFVDKYRDFCRSKTTA